MIGAVGRFLRSRGVRKLLRDRLAIVALSVIAVYLAVAGAVGLFGFITEEEASDRIGPDQLVGQWGTPSVEKRKKLSAGARSVVSCAAEEPFRNVTFGCVLA